MNDKKLLQIITRRLEEYGMPKFKDIYPAMDILQLVKDFGYIHKDNILENLPIKRYSQNTAGRIISNTRYNQGYNRAIDKMSIKLKKIFKNEN